MFDYNYIKDFTKKLIICSQSPIQVELQTCKGCGAYKCKFCYGLHQELTDGPELTREDYYRLLDDIRGSVRFITLAGIKSEPLNNPHIYDILKRIKENGFRLGIHTKGFLLTEAISNLLNTDTAYGDFITFSIDASGPKIYNDLHGLPERAQFFESIVKNIRYLYDRKKLTQSSLNVNVSYLLFKENSDYKQMNHFVEMFADNCDVIRFSMPQLPNKEEARPDYYLDSHDQVEKDIELIKKDFPDKKILFLNFEDHAHDTHFPYCHAQRFQAVIDHCGYVFPCPQVATDQFRQIAYGNIRDRGFWNVWNSDSRRRIVGMRVDNMACRICDRKDEALNEYANNLFDNEKAD